MWLNPVNAYQCSSHFIILVDYFLSWNHFWFCFSGIFCFSSNHSGHSSFVTYSHIIHSLEASALSKVSCYYPYSLKICFHSPEVCHEPQLQKSTWPIDTTSCMFLRYLRLTHLKLNSVSSYSVGPLFVPFLDEWYHYLFGAKTRKLVLFDYLLFVLASRSIFFCPWILYVLHKS